MKKLFLACLLTLVCFSMLGRDIRRIYVWDVTLSMIGKGGQDIWDITKKAINDDIESIYDKNTEIIIIPFQHRLITEDMVSAYGDEGGKKAIMDAVSGYDIPRLWNRQEEREIVEGEAGTTTKTKLSEPLMSVVEKYLDPQKRNVIMFLSDGCSDDDVFPGDQAKFDSLVTSPALCEKLNNLDSYLFYFALTESAENANLKEYAFKDSCTGRVLYVNTDADSETSRLVIYSMLVELPKEKSFNVAYDYDNDGIEFKLQNTTSVPKEFRTLDYKLHVKSVDNDFIKIDQDVEIGSNLSFVVRPELCLSKEEMISRLGIGETIVELEVSIPEEMKKYPYNMTSLAPGSEKIYLKILNTEQNRVSITSSSASGNYEFFRTWDLWPFSYYAPDEISIEDKLELSVVEDASDMDGSIVLGLYDLYGEPVGTDKVELFVDGEKSADNKVVFVPSVGQTRKNAPEVITKEIELKLCESLLEAYDDDRTFQYYFEVEKTPSTLHVLNGQNVGDDTSLDEMSICFNVDYKVNKLKAWVITALIIILAVLVAIIVLVQLFAKRFNVKHLTQIFVSENDVRKGIMSCKSGLKGATKIILTSDRNKKQGFFAMLFKGKISYVYIANLPAEISLTVGSKGRVSHVICYKSVNVIADFDILNRRMILSCKSETIGTEYKIEYPKK